jgi:hypothetical protein
LRRCRCSRFLVHALYGILFDGSESLLLFVDPNQVFLVSRCHRRLEEWRWAFSFVASWRALERSKRALDNNRDLIYVIASCSVPWHFHEPWSVPNSVPQRVGTKLARDLPCLRLVVESWKRTHVHTSLP